MVTAVITAPVPPPTMAPMPTMAKAGTLSGVMTPAELSRAAKAPPSVAPMNSDGEKMPPEDPEPRLSDVASSLARVSRPRSQKLVRRPESTAWTVA
jgi:hypothetical protein